MNNIKLSLIILAVIVLVPSCINDEAVQVPYNGNTPVEIDDGMQISTPDAQGFDTEKLEEIYTTLSNEEVYPNLKSLLVMKNGHLVAESYFKDPGDLERIHAVMSITKSITSLVTGIAIDKGFLDSIDIPVYNYLSGYFDNDTSKKDITLRHLLTMESGLDYDNEVHTNEMIYCKGSSLSYVLSRPMTFSPGEDWYYGDGNPQLISGIITSLSGKTMEEIASEYLFKPLEIREYFWEQHSDGLSLGGMGLWLKPRDMAKIGQLMLNNGVWEGQEVLSGEWISESTIKRANHRDYGYFWLTSENISFWASGKGGQIIWILPGENLVVVVTSDSFAKTWLLSEGSYDYIFQAIYDAIIR